MCKAHLCADADGDLADHADTDCSDADADYADSHLTILMLTQPRWFDADLQLMLKLNVSILYRRRRQ